MTDDGMMGKRHVIGKTEEHALLTCTENFVKFRHAVFDIYERTDIGLHTDTEIHTDRQTDTLIAVVRTCISGEVKIHKDTDRLCFNHATCVYIVL